jgi:hypothetical protein
MTLEDGTDILTRNTCNQIRLYAAKHSREANTLTRDTWNWICQTRSYNSTKMKERVDVWTDKRNNGHVTSLCSALRTASSIRLLNEEQQVRIIRFNKRRKPFSPLWRTSSRHNQRITNTCVNKRNRNVETSQIKFNRTLFLCARTALVISQS